MSIHGLILQAKHIVKQLPKIYIEYATLNRRIATANSATSKRITLTSSKDISACLFSMSGVSFEHDGIGRDYFIPISTFCDNMKMFNPREFKNNIRAENPFIEIFLTMLIFWKIFCYSQLILTFLFTTKFIYSVISSGNVVDAMNMFVLNWVPLMIMLSTTIAIIMAIVIKNRVLRTIGFYLNIINESSIEKLQSVKMIIQKNLFATFTA